MSDIRSFSQWSDMATCPYSFQLKRVDKVDQIPAAWTAGGTAIHEALEAWEKSLRTLVVDEVVAVFETAYDREIEALRDQEPDLSRWFASGPYGADQDIPRRRDMGRDQIRKTLSWYANHPGEVPWIHPDGRIGVELEFHVKLGSVLVRGFVDWYGNLGHTPLGPRDYKSGRNAGKHMQLKLYDIAMDKHYESRDEPRPGGGSGDFFMTRTGKPTVGMDLTQIGLDEVVTEFERIDEEIRAGDFPALPSEDTCKFCPVRRACKYRAV